MNRSTWNSHQLGFMAKQKICNKNFSLHSVRRLSTAKKLSEKWKIQNFFSYSELPWFWLYARQVSLKSDEKFFFDAQWAKMTLKVSENIFSPILTKLSVHIVRFRAVPNMKKDFEIFHFSDNFFAVDILCTLWSEKFLLQNFCFAIKPNWCEFQALRFMRTNFGF